MRISFPWSRFSRFQVWWQGRKDGKAGIPPVDQIEHAPYENSIKNWAEENIHRLAQKWEKIDQILKKNYCSTVVSLKTFRKRIADIQGEYQQSAEEVETAERKLHELSDRKHLSKKSYLFFMILLGFSEFPINTIVFNLFGEARWFTFLMTTMLAVGLPLLAHFCGMILKKDSHYGTISKKEKVFLIFLLLIVIAVIISIAYFREKYFESMGISRLLNIDIDPMIITLTYFAINALIFMGAMLIAYYHYDPEIQQWERALNQASDDFEEDEYNLKKYRTMVYELEKKVQEYQEIRQNTWDEIVAKAGEIEKICKRIIDDYRRHNLAAREDKTLPESFKRYPEISFPESLKKLNWECAEKSIEE